MSGRPPPTKRVYACLPNDKFVTISVGSGLGTRERALNPGTICVDPAPYSWQTNDEKLLTLLPHYGTVQEMIQTSKGQSYIHRCILCLFHPYPSPQTEGEKKMYDSAGYDYEAIQLLQPLFVFLLLVHPKNSGSARLWEWLEQRQYQKQNYVRIIDFISQEESDRKDPCPCQVRYVLLVQRSHLTYMNKYKLIQC